MDHDMSVYLTSTPTINFDDRTVMEYASAVSGTSADPVEQAVNLFYAVRDDIRYDPYSVDLSPEGLSASATLKKGRGWCVAKAILLAACCRAVKIPARLGFADVRNHLSTERLLKSLKTDVFFWHGYTSIYLSGNWIKATPAFNIALCERFGIKPLNFDGENDAIIHPYDLQGKKHMEYLNYRGEFPDVPINEIMETFFREYPGALSWSKSDFEEEREQDMKKRRKAKG